ncbi:zinc ribbon domain-containing protein [Rhizobium leguminosarum]|nr:zinc ribbon domain-containing protein [Rhizobium leguminosarum]TBE93274.1 zinc ribbon domain-containing protein [Rhizobium leguminosarum]TBZ98280.1 zinc ribbon domain-containing protein [Rhizobium leguminosarum bv. viciae]
MTEVKRFQCLNCGHRFEVDVLTPDEKKEAKRNDEAVYPIACPQCRKTDVRGGWG